MDMEDASFAYFFQSDITGLCFQHDLLLFLWSQCIITSIHRPGVMDYVNLSVAPTCYGCVKTRQSDTSRLIFSRTLTVCPAACLSLCPRVCTQYVLPNYRFSDLNARSAQLLVRYLLRRTEVQLHGCVTKARFPLITGL